MSYTTPRNWVDGELEDASIFNTHLRDQLNALTVRGTWTPVIGGAGGTSGQTYSIQVGKYVLDYNSFSAWAYVKLSAKGTITGAVQISGLPFTAENTTNLRAVATIGLFAGLSTSWIWLGGYVLPNSSVIVLNGTQSASTATSGLTTTDIGNNTELVISVQYTTV